MINEPIFNDNQDEIQSNQDPNIKHIENSMNDKANISPILGFKENNNLNDIFDNEEPIKINKRLNLDADNDEKYMI